MPLSSDAPISYPKGLKLIRYKHKLYCKHYRFVTTTILVCRTILLYMVKFLKSSTRLHLSLLSKYFFVLASVYCPNFPKISKFIGKVQANPCS